MNRPPRASIFIKIVVSAACLACLCLAPIATAGAAASVKYQQESAAAYEQQLAAGEIRAATFNHKVRSLRLVLKDGRRMLVKYASGEGPKLTRQLRAKGVPVTVLTHSQAVKESGRTPVHHKLRYIVGGIVVAVIVVVGAVLLFNRRRQRQVDV
jgi:hypothetical protein